jgi:hypothetical protein
MKKQALIWHLRSLAAVAVACSLGVAAEGQTITFLSSTNGSDYSDAGLNLGNAGFWFANFNNRVAVSGAPIDANARNSLPSWVTIDPTPDTTFASTATTKGGQPNWATLTLPDGSSGLSGAVVDSGTDNNSNNTIRALALGAGTPSSFIFHVVTDNTAGEHDPAGRLRARGERSGVFDISGPNAPTGLGTNMNGSPDVYTWRYEGFASGDIIKLQLNSGVAGEQASIAGIMFDPIPEPASGVLFAMAAAGMLSAARRRR